MSELQNLQKKICIDRNYYIKFEKL